MAKPNPQSSTPSPAPGPEETTTPLAPGPEETTTPLAPGPEEIQTYLVNWDFSGFRPELLHEGDLVEATADEAAPYLGGVLTLHELVEE